eukprot:SAG11_NODE_7703_length_1107_cov_158.341270_1_plen_335_part_01
MPRVLVDKRVLVRQDFENVGTGGFVEYEDVVASTYTEPEGEGNPESQDLGELDPDGDMDIPHDEDDRFGQPENLEYRRYPEFDNPDRPAVTSTIKQMRGYVRTMNKKMTVETIAELMARKHFNDHIRVFHIPQRDGVRTRPGFRVDPRQGPVIVPVSYEDVKQLVKRSRKDKIAMTFYFSLDWMPSCQYIQDVLPEFLPRDPLLREYEGYPLFSFVNTASQMQALLEIHDNDVEAARVAREAREAEERAAAREAARIAAEEARAARAAAREAARIAAEEAEAARIQAEEDEEDDPTPTPTPTRGDGTIAPERRVDETVHVWIENPETGKKQRVEV